MLLGLGESRPGVENLGGPVLCSLSAFSSPLTVRGWKTKGDLVRSLGSSEFIPEAGIYPGSEEGKRLPSQPVSYVVDSSSGAVVASSVLS